MPRFDDFFRRVRPLVPFSPPNIAYKMVSKKVITLLDVGCGSGEPIQFFKRKNHFYALGVDIFKPYLKWCKSRGTHDDYVLCDVRMLPFRQQSVDLIICLEVLEHLDKVEGRKLVSKFENLAKHQIILSTPAGEQVQHLYDGNKYQEHKSGWSSEEFIKRGFLVRGLGFPLVYGLRLTDLLPKSMGFVGYAVWTLSSPFVYFVPRFSGSLVCSKLVTCETLQNNLAID